MGVWRLARLGLAPGGGSQAALTQPRTDTSWPGAAGPGF
jgi:hypothetical protein